MRIRAHLKIKKAAITGVDGGPLTIVSIVHNTRIVRYVAVNVVADDRSIRSFGGNS